MFTALKDRVGSLFGGSEGVGFARPGEATGFRRFRFLLALAAIVALFVAVLGISWSFEPDPFGVAQNAQQKVALNRGNVQAGSVSTAALIRVAETLLDKPGGYLTNDIVPPGLYLDNIPNWEFGVLVQVRDFSRALRESFSRAQSQSQEDLDLREAEPLFSFDNQSWMFPATEGEYRRAINYLYSYLNRISNPNGLDGQFFARADNLASWLITVESRLGSLSCRLSACVGFDPTQGGAVSGVIPLPLQSDARSTTPWLQVDDIFYEARGTTWALLHFLRAIEIDFADVLEDKNASASLQQIIRDLEFSQRAVFPVILNGSGFGIFPNHSLTMANYVSRANAAIIDLRSLLAQG